jgi:hypothetical protein
MTNGVLLARATKEPFSLLWIQPPSGGYRITARAYDSFFLSRESEPVHVYVGGLVLPRISRGPYLQSCSSTGLVLKWRTDWFSEGVVRYGTDLANLAHAATNAAPLFEHEMSLSGLQPDTPYFYSIGTTTQAMVGGPSFYFRTAPTNS